MIKNNKISIKDLITTAIFSVLFFLLMRTGQFISILLMVNVFAPAIEMVLCGVVWVYMRVKMPKPFCILIQCLLLALFVFLAGSVWYIAAGAAAGGVLAEIISGIGRYKNFKLGIAAYAAYGLCFNFGCYGVILLARDYWQQFARAAGIDTGLIDKMSGFIDWPLFGVSSILVVIGAVAGILLGRLMLKKHFKRAGIV
jgi:energy-coupling factor transport system substrate-specific component